MRGCSLEVVRGHFVESPGTASFIDCSCLGPVELRLISVELGSDVIKFPSSIVASRRSAELQRLPEMVRPSGLRKLADGSPVE